MALAAETLLSVNRELLTMCYKDHDFKIYCRRELINILTNVHYSSKIRYLQLLQQALNVQNMFCKTEATCRDIDIFAAVFNKWLLNKKNKLKDKNRH